MEFDEKILNEEQLQPLKQTEGAVLVTAGAGSGKTRLLTYRVAYLIEEKGVSPYNILAITFTNKASNEMRERLIQMLPLASEIWISTFHSMCAKMLRRDIDKMPPFTRDFSIYSESDSEKVLKEVCSELGQEDDKFRKRAMYHLSNYKNVVQELDEYLSSHEDEYSMDKIGNTIRLYQEKLKKYNALDFDDLLQKTVQLFEMCPQVLSYYANRFRYILVDEFQDTNLIQYKLVKMLASVHGNIFVVGDEDQCIYSWRGANFQNIFNFKRDFSDVHVYKLERNYRSSKEIIQIANNVIKNNRQRLNKNMWTDKEEGEKPILYNAVDERDEALFVAKTIEKLKSQGYNYKDMAVLMRMNSLSRNFEEAFLSYNIPHRIFGGFKFYERAEIRIVIGYLRLFTNPKDDVSFARIINFPKRGIGEGTLARLAQIDPDKSLLENALSPEFTQNQAIFKKFAEFVAIFKKLSIEKQNPISKFVEKVITEFKIKSAYNIKDEEDLNRVYNIEQFIQSVREYEALNPDSTLSDFLESITLYSDNDQIGQEGQVTIATVHAVKGLEFKVVFVVGLEEGIFPISRALNSNFELEEERRLCYVALTRAMERLYLSYASKRYLYHESQFQVPSRFCREIGLLSLERPKPRVNVDRFNYEDDYKQNIPNRIANSSKVELWNKNILSEKKEEYKPKKDVSIYQVGQKVEHPKFGEGIILQISSDHLVGDIDFENFGKKSLMLELAPLTIIE